MKLAGNVLIGLLVLTTGTSAGLTFGCGGRSQNSDFETGGTTQSGGESGGINGDGGSGGGSARCAVNDLNCDQVPDDIGRPVYDQNGLWVDGDFNNDFIGDGKAIDEEGGSLIDGVGLDTDDDGYIDSIDRDGDGLPDKTTGVGEVGGSGGAP